MTKAEPGDNIGFNIAGVAKNEIGEARSWVTRTTTNGRQSIRRPNYHHFTINRPSLPDTLRYCTPTRYGGVTFEGLIRN